MHSSLHKRKQWQNERATPSVRRCVSSGPDAAKRGIQEEHDAPIDIQPRCRSRRVRMQFRPYLHLERTHKRRRIFGERRGDPRIAFSGRRCRMQRQNGRRRLRGRV